MAIMNTILPISIVCIWRVSSTKMIGMTAACGKLGSGNPGMFTYQPEGNSIRKGIQT